MPTCGMFRHGQRESGGRNGWQSCYRTSARYAPLISKNLSTADNPGPLGVPHGVTSCIMCPAVMKYNLKHGHDNPDISRRQEKVKEILWSEQDVARQLQDAGLQKDFSDLGDALDVLIRALGMPRTLSDMNISSDVIPALSERTLADHWSPTNPIPLLKAVQVQEILEMVV